MNKSLGIFMFVSICALQHAAFAIETAPHISDREIVERLTRLEEGQGSLRGEVKQLREDMNKQFDRLVNIVLCIIGVFASMCGGTIWFALWDRRTMIRPFEDKAKKIEDNLSENRATLHTLLDAFRSLGKTDEKVANILRKFNLL